MSDSNDIGGLVGLAAIVLVGVLYIGCAANPDVPAGIDSTGYIAHRVQSTITAQSNWMVGESKECISIPLDAHTGHAQGKQAGYAFSSLWCGKGPTHNISITLWGAENQPGTAVARWNCTRRSDSFACKQTGDESIKAIVAPEPNGAESPTTLDEAFTISEALKTQAKQAEGDWRTVISDPSSGSAKMGLMASFLRNAVGAHSAASDGANIRVTNAEWQMAVRSNPWLSGMMFNVSSGSDDTTIIDGISLSQVQASDMFVEILQRALRAKQEYATLSAAQHAPTSSASAHAAPTYGVSLKLAMTLPVNKGKTKQQVAASIRHYGYAVLP